MIFYDISYTLGFFKFKNFTLVTKIVYCPKTVLTEWLKRERYIFAEKDAGQCYYNILTINLILGKMR